MSGNRHVMKPVIVPTIDSLLGGKNYTIDVDFINHDLTVNYDHWRSFPLEATPFFQYPNEAQLAGLLPVTMMANYRPLTRQEFNPDNTAPSRAFIFSLSALNNEQIKDISVRYRTPTLTAGGTMCSNGAVMLNASTDIWRGGYLVDRLIDVKVSTDIYGSNTGDNYINLQSQAQRGVKSATPTESLLSTNNSEKELIFTDHNGQRVTIPSDPALRQAEQRRFLEDKEIHITSKVPSTANLQQVKQRMEQTQILPLTPDVQSCQQDTIDTSSIYSDPTFHMDRISDRALLSLPTSDTPYTSSGDDAFEMEDHLALLVTAQSLGVPKIIKDNVRISANINYVYTPQQHQHRMLLGGHISTCDDKHHLKSMFSPSDDSSFHQWTSQVGHHHVGVKCLLSPVVIPQVKKQILPFIPKRHSQEYEFQYAYMFTQDRWEPKAGYIHSHKGNSHNNHPNASAHHSISSINGDNLPTSSVVNASLQQAEGDTTTTYTIDQGLLGLGSIGDTDGILLQPEGQNLSSSSAQSTPTATTTAADGTLEQQNHGSSTQQPLPPPQQSTTSTWSWISSLPGNIYSASSNLVQSTQRTANTAYDSIPSIHTLQSFAKSPQQLFYRDSQREDALYKDDPRMHKVARPWVLVGGNISTTGILQTVGAWFPAPKWTLTACAMTDISQRNSFVRPSTPLQNLTFGFGIQYG